MKKSVKAMPVVADHNMVEAAYMLLETEKLGTPERHKSLVMKIWATMAEYAPVPKQGRLTMLQRRAYETIADYIDEHGISPSYREIGEQLGTNKPHVHQIVHALRKRGFITLREGKRRSIGLVVRPGEELTSR